MRAGGGNLSNVLFYTDGNSWKVYNSFDIVNKSLSQIESIVDLGPTYPYQGVRMEWVPAKSPYLGARERVSKLYGDIHKIKLKVTLDLNKI